MSSQFNLKRYTVASALCTFFFLASFLLTAIPASAGAGDQAFSFKSIRGALTLVSNKGGNIVISEGRDGILVEVKDPLGLVQTDQAAL